MMIHRRSVAAAVAALAFLPRPVLAHHGWGWASDEEMTLEGVIRGVRLGNPHGELQVEDASGALWIAELGQPWRHARAGLPEAELVPGVAVVIEGHRAADPADLRIKAERIVLAGMRYNLYPDRS